MTIYLVEPFFKFVDITRELESLKLKFLHALDDQKIENLLWN